MSKKLLVTLRSPEDADQVRQTGVQVLAEYPDSLLVLGDDAQTEQLAEAGIETAPLPETQVQVSGGRFAFADAVEAEEAAPVRAPAGRRAYYLVKLVGPATPGWLEALGADGAEIHGTLPGFTLLVGMLPEHAPRVAAEPWVEAVTPYRAAMKVSPKLRRFAGQELDVPALSAVDMERVEEPQFVEISVFDGESVQEVAARVRDAGGEVVSTLPRTLTATVPPAAIPRLAEIEGVQAILPHALPELHNDRATRVMGVPADHVFADLTLKGTNQIVAVADSGLDTGNAATVHADIRGRVAGLISLPTSAVWTQYTNDPPGADDGPADANTGHGTHVTGSVLGNGASAAGLGATTVPAGTAPEARVFFQALEQHVSWKTAAQLAAGGLARPLQPWPPPEAGLYGLPNDIGQIFQQAYAAGARIHSNSWGAPVAGAYNQNARIVDQFMWDHPDILILFSAGNEGVDADANGTIDPGSINSPGTAKNCLTVGATENDRPAGSAPKPGIDGNWDQLSAGGGPLKWPQLGPAGHVSDNPDGMAAFSSRGPADDGRVKPDVAAPGTNILSMLSSVYAGASPPLWGFLAADDPLRPFYCWSGGTSMATPLVAGLTALVRQHLVDQRGHVQAGRKPSGALVKAFIVNGAVRISGQFSGEIPTGVNSVDGFGRVQATGSLVPDPLHRTAFADEPDHAVATGEIRPYQVQVADPGQPLRVTLAWTDAPAPPGLGGLVNQLYLQVLTPGGTVLDGDLTAFPTVSNNVQQVLIDAPVAGTYTIRVRGVQVTRQAPGAGPGASPRQDFAVAVSNAVGTSMEPETSSRSMATASGRSGVLQGTDPV